MVRIVPTAEERLVANEVEMLRRKIERAFEQYSEGLVTEKEVLQSVLLSLNNAVRGVEMVKGNSHYCPVHAKKLYRAVVGDGKTTWMCPEGKCLYSKEVSS